MSELTDALRRIESWLQHHAPSMLETLLPGLTEPEIEQATTDLPFYMPDDLCELYQWRNGNAMSVDYGASFLPAYVLNPLEVAVKRYQQEVNFQGWEMWDQRWLPLFQYECDYFFAEVGKPVQSPSKIREFFREDPSYNLVYHSLTSMMQTIAECYETGAYWIESKDRSRYDPETGEIQTFVVEQVERDHDSALEIHRNYNPDIKPRTWWFL